MSIPLKYDLYQNCKSSELFDVQLILWFVGNLSNDIVEELLEGGTIYWVG